MASSLALAQAAAVGESAETLKVMLIWKEEMKTRSRIPKSLRVPWLGQSLFYSRQQVPSQKPWAELVLKGIGAHKAPVLPGEDTEHACPQSSCIERASLASSGHHYQALGKPCANAVLGGMRGMTLVLRNKGLSLAQQSWVKYNSGAVNVQPHLTLEPESEQDVRHCEFHTEVNLTVGMLSCNALRQGV